MAKKNPVRRLSNLALTELAGAVVCAISRAYHGSVETEIAVAMVDVKSYLDSLGATSDIYQDLIKLILRSDNLEAAVRFNCLQTLLNCSVHCLITEVFPFSYYEKILQVIAVQGTGLRTLNLKGVWIKEEHMDYMFALLKKLKNLVNLSIPYIANDDLLEVIGKHNPNLRYIDVSGETDITDIGIESLSLSAARDRLTVVDIGMLGDENICHTDIAMLITHLPRLENLVTYSYVGKSLKYIRDQDPDFTCRLRNLHDTKTNVHVMDCIVKMCPNLESIYLDTPDSGVIIKLKDTMISKLKIYKFQCSELMDLFQQVGANITQLTMINGRGSIELGNLARQCTSLIDMDCYMMDQITYLLDTHFTTLQGLEMLNSPINPTSLKKFISNTPTIIRLAIDSVSFDDDDIRRFVIIHNWGEIYIPRILN